MQGSRIGNQISIVGQRVVAALDRRSCCLVSGVLTYRTYPMVTMQLISGRYPRLATLISVLMKTARVGLQKIRPGRMHIQRTSISDMPSSHAWAMWLGALVCFSGRLVVV